MDASLPPEIKLAQALAEIDKSLAAGLSEHNAEFGELLASLYFETVAHRMIELAQEGEHEKLKAMGQLIETALVGDRIATDMIRFGFADTIKRSGKADLVAPFIGSKLTFWIETAP